MAMKDDGINRREFLKGAVAGGAVATTTAVGLAPQVAEAQQKPAAAPANPGYSYLNLEEAAFVEAMVDGSVAMGLSREDATTLTIQTIVGAAALLDESGDTPTRLREKVTSLKGATAEALAVFDEAGISKIVADAMTASARRAGELAQ